MTESSAKMAPSVRRRRGGCLYATAETLARRSGRAGGSHDVLLDGIWINFPPSSGLDENGSRVCGVLLIEHPRLRRPLRRR